jgi:hypothetical protein
MALFKRKSARKEEIILCMLKNDLNRTATGIPAAFVSKRGMRNGKTALRGAAKPCRFHLQQTGNGTARSWKTAFDEKGRKFKIFS